MQDGKHVILCVDDDPDILSFLKIVLKGEGYVVTEATSAEEGLRVYKATPPDLVILDLMMEEVDAGTSFVKELKALGNKAPIYMLSSTGDNLAMATDYSALGLAGVFQKPIAKEKLIAMIKAKLG
jgi:DNA-binding response OmpR family regulator